MAGLFALAYGLIRGTAAIADDIQQKKVEEIEYSTSVIEGNKIYSHNGQLYWTATKMPCHIYVEPNGNKQIRSGHIYGQGMVLLDYNKEINKEYEESQRVKFNVAKEEYHTKNKRYYNALEYNYDFEEKKRYVTRSSKENDLYWIEYLVNHNGTWCYDNIHDCSKPISFEEWVKCGGNSATIKANVPYLSDIIKKEKKENKERELKAERERQLIIQKEQEEKINQEVLTKSWITILVLFILFIMFISI